jgi:hypothetical protein
MVRRSVVVSAVLKQVLSIGVGILYLWGAESHASTTHVKLTRQAPVQAEPIVVRLTPPRQELIAPELVTVRSQACTKDDATRGEEGARAAYCDRPCRTEGIRIELEQIQNTNFASTAKPEDNTGFETKTVLHCYGHGEYGISTFFGSVQHALALLMKTNPDLDTPIRVIGAGCVGLTMALELKRKGFTQVSISTKEKYSIPSWRAGGFFVPGVGSESTPETRIRENAGMVTYLFFRAAQMGKNPYVNSDIVRWLPVYCPVDEECGAEILGHLRLVPQPDLVTLDFGNGVTHTGYKRHWSYFIDVVELMIQLWDCVERAEIPVIYESVSSFADCPEAIICNCAGAGASQFCADSALIPTRGHFLMLQVTDNWFEPGMDYMITTHVMQDGKKELLYFFPKPAFVPGSGERSVSGEVGTHTGDVRESGVREQLVCAGMIGGTLVPRSECDADGVRDQAEYAKLAARARKFF